ncbi:MAG: phosphoribosylaminoimidazolesuccinocarboxamide synthase [Candidatus Pacebacteria bacterium]|nr:phosphoribosylaminoimidazolesuccinocarboxamide synthase [Candidatus Paceibacterota bacterium]MCF7863053.1 phosphoribosylaminoimidazolesuccinocarboxamide synthase [Candidatus Paceibacterota bacterium]
MNLDLIKENIENVLEDTHFPSLGEKKKGKVRDIYASGENLTLISTDRHSSFDRNIALIPFKGEVLNQISLFWFEKTKDIIANHVLNSPDPSILVAKKCTPLAIECVMRGYITGVTDTSLWTHYKKGKRDFGDFVLPDGMYKNQKLETPVFTPTTKNDKHDRPVTIQEIITEKLLPAETIKTLEEKSKALFARGQEIALEKGLILVDTKYEFGLDENNQIILIDEIHTPDSSRYWKASTYEERIQKGEEPEYFDKEFLRLWFKENCDPYNDPVLPKAPNDLVAELSRRYVEIYETITGNEFKHDFSQTTKERVSKSVLDLKTE